MTTRTRFSIVSILLIVVAVVIAARPSAVQSDTKGKPVPRWEHLALTSDDANVLGDGKLAKQIVSLGNEGWELVTVAAINKEGTTAHMIFCFKRPK